MKPDTASKVSKVMLAKMMGWTLSYIDDELDVNEYHETLDILNAVEKAHAYKRDVANWKSQGAKARR